MVTIRVAAVTTLTILTSSLKNFGWLKGTVSYGAIASSIAIGTTALSTQFSYQTGKSAPDR
jgi:hypothetical protein